MGHFYVSVGLRLHFNPKSFPQHYEAHEETKGEWAYSLLHSFISHFFLALSRCFTFIIHVGARRTIVYKTKKSTIPLTHRIRFFILRSLILPLASLAYFYFSVSISFFSYNGYKLIFHFLRVVLFTMIVTLKIIFISPL